MEEPVQNVVHATFQPKHATFLGYLNGFILSVVFTVWAYIATIRHALSRHTLIATLLTLAFAQFLVQLFFFLHIGHETKPRWKLLLLFMMIVFVLILVIGSIWIMYSLNYRMTPQQMNTYLLKQDGGI
ncbi:MAG TPA: cytochrome o ubiquinol oxidase subunit IV [Candidatus Saccharimonadales bacterium]|nr:cytochrome o ubiquinol oxidase subunit IV [Candidatus Saccharimonadales bacterium]